MPSEPAAWGSMVRYVPEGERSVLWVADEEGGKVGGRLRRGCSLFITILRSITIKKSAMNWILGRLQQSSNTVLHWKTLDCSYKLEKMVHMSPHPTAEQLRPTIGDTQLSNGLPSRINTGCAQAKRHYQSAVNTPHGRRVRAKRQHREESHRTSSGRRTTPLIHWAFSLSFLQSLGL